MLTSLTVIKVNSVEFNYGMAIIFFRIGLRLIEQGGAKGAALDAFLVNEYIDRAIALMR